MNKITRRHFLCSSIVVGTGLTLGITGCAGDDDDSDNEGSAAQTEAKFGIISDPHIYDLSLGTTGEAFQEALDSDRKMFLESVEILETIVADLLTEELDFVLVPGDLTKDGERICHEKFRSIMMPLRDAGIPVYVVPGNHDINNSHAYSYSGSIEASVPNVSPAEFEEIYEDFGFGAAIYKDSNSLSYIAEVADNVWLFAIDSCKYGHTAGEITEAAQQWIKDMLAQASAEGKLVFGMLHHGMTPHFALQPMMFGEYVIDDYEAVGKTLADAGLNLFFTGHFHAQDIAVKEFEASTLYDVETGSSVTAPSPYRVVELDIPSKSFDIYSSVVETLPSMPDFATYKEEFLNSGMLRLNEAYLTALGLDTSLAPATSEIYISHLKGDEPGYTNMSAGTAAAVNYMITNSDPTYVQLGYGLVDWAEDDTPDGESKITL
jgi:predicted phosphodiesterase